jgi:hypothetical protein
MNSNNIVSTAAKITIHTRTAGTIYYLCVDVGYPLITSVDTIIALNSTIGMTGTVNSTGQTVLVSNVAQINYIAIANLSKLNSSKGYIFYAVLKSELGVSIIKTISFKTEKLSKGVLMKLTFGNVV